MTAPLNPFDPIAGQNLLPKDGETYFFPDFFTPEASDSYFESLRTGVEWKHEPIVIFGKSVLQPRLTAWYGDAGTQYSYSGITMTPTPWSPEVLEIKGRAEAAAGKTFNSALLNFYRDERDSVGWHRDNESTLGDRPVIASVSFGATRTFQLRHYAEKTLKTAVALSHGSFLLMHGETQHYWEHCIPKRSRPLGPRINITFRSIVR